MEIGLIIAIGFALSLPSPTASTTPPTRSPPWWLPGVPRPGRRSSLSAVFNMAGAVFLGTAVADTIGKIVTVPQPQMRCPWSARVRRCDGLESDHPGGWGRRRPRATPSSGDYRLVAAERALSGDGGRNWSNGRRRLGNQLVIVLVALLISPPLIFAFAFVLLELLRLAPRRWTTWWTDPVRGGG